MLGAVAGGVQGASAGELANQLFGAHRAPSAQPPAVVGAYARGCAAGLVELAETGPGWQAMRLGRNRNWGHPQTIAFIKDLAGAAQSIGWRGIYVGDISQPRGGPMTSGHTSHQTGLDVDIWMLPPARLNLSRAERESISSISVRTADQRSVNANWTAQHHALLRAAALDVRVDRIFVAAAVKIEMCRTAARADRAWLQKIRPFSGHNTHFHVRMRCPADSPLCETQTPTVADLSNGGDGCDETLMWWVTDYLDPPPPDPDAPAPPPRRHPRSFTMADLPAQCGAVLTAR
ncbi:penicillin-insensitive murein endopeptidase [Alkalilacustris brevis]|uniref:penicillin-insensitive murein endopeptidase n=1 Tax=Alkalilacustris brevis TaxID=2026338 RepID=UPI001EE3D23C|nr:penicillin-insensitive murein endopeptidase [Alkalilacustris brevis]